MLKLRLVMAHQEQEANPRRICRVLRTVEEASLMTATLAVPAGLLGIASGILSGNNEVAVWGSRTFMGGLTIAGGIAVPELVRMLKDRGYNPFQYSYLQGPQVAYINPNMAHMKEIDFPFSHEDRRHPPVYQATNLAELNLDVALWKTSHELSNPSILGKINRILLGIETGMENIFSSPLGSISLGASCPEMTIQRDSRSLTSILTILPDVKHNPVLDPAEKTHFGGILRTPLYSMMLTDGTATLEVHPPLTVQAPWTIENFYPIPSIFEKLSDDPKWLERSRGVKIPELYGLPLFRAFDADLWDYYRSRIWSHPVAILSQIYVNSRLQVIEKHWLMDIFDPHISERGQRGRIVLSPDLYRKLFGEEGYKINPKLIPVPVPAEVQALAA